MKTIATIIFVLFVGVAAQAQEGDVTLKDQAVEMTGVAQPTYEEITIEKKLEVARLYKRSNAKIKKALSFTTKKNRPKMA
ncbi:hypothetical protein [Pareuzebyella sediminis]|uniref:hypothetical protein n=1 Tax=Pareuzebyella sediminis TaxID=2607998 RepID=UPI0011EBC66B|nr:hypothetical protein [Pareuzebyella sediminis]